MSVNFECSLFRSTCLFRTSVDIVDMCQVLNIYELNYYCMNVNQNKYKKYLMYLSTDEFLIHFHTQRQKLQDIKMKVKYF